MECNVDNSAPVAHAAPVGEVAELERLRAVEQVGQVEVADVVADNEVRVRLHHQVLRYQRVKIEKF